ncbi:GIY-YIG nuclease family protein [Proteocatella sphenisci]|uniref:GIY-YIG nuclease family protein n=1 Tax=Proteocatella sphenisci TaxID=181070 RepID=UPI0004BCB76C|nr:GIY-YIG nuclease family protein [Proteocatella sphenisci]
MAFILFGIVVFLSLNLHSYKKKEKDFVNLVTSKKAELTALEKRKNEEWTKMEQQKKDELSSIEKLIANKDSEWQKIVDEAKAHAGKEIVEISKNKSFYSDEVIRLKNDYEKYTKSCITQENKLRKIKEIYRSMDSAINNYTVSDFSFDKLRLPNTVLDEAEQLSPSVVLKLNCMDIKSLRKSFNDNNKLIDEVLTKYAQRYTTKANATIYKLMVIALRAELQNILYSLKYDKLSVALGHVSEISKKYLQIASDGNQSIAPTLVKFIGELEYLFFNAVHIEYEYYVKKEQAKLEQQAIREQLRQEAEERKELKRQQEQLDKEESKYVNEIDKIKDQLASADSEKQEQLNARIKELESQIQDIESKKSEIVNLQNGKAGSVYVISNMGAFGENVFKVGMTRRLEPMDRIKELSSASVPFSFDVHSLIFSNDAVNLEQTLHQRLNDKRVNMINLRKEFFRTSIDELEALVNEIDISAEFNKTMLAEEFRQSCDIIENGLFPTSSDEIDESDYENDENYDENYEDELEDVI